MEDGLRGVGTSLTVNGRVVAAVAVVKAPGLEVDDADEHGDEDTALVVGGHGVIQFGGYDLGGQSFLGDGAEQVDGDRHRERGGYALAADIADAETEAVVLE